MNAEAVGRWRVLIVEDHVALGDALRLAAEMDAGLECVGVVRTVAEALEMVARESPDVVLMDVRLPDGDGIEATGRIKDLRPATAVIVVTAGADAGALLRAARAGASGFLPKETRMAGILDGARRAASGELVVAPSALQSLLAAARHDVAPPPPAARELSSGERQLLAGLAEGQKMAELAAGLGLTPEACRQQLKAAAEALGARSPLDALVTAARAGLLPR